MSQPRRAMVAVTLIVDQARYGRAVDRCAPSRGDQLRCPSSATLPTYVSASHFLNRHRALCTPSLRMLSSFLPLLAPSRTPGTPDGHLQPRPKTPPMPNVALTPHPYYITVTFLHLRHSPPRAICMVFQSAIHRRRGSSLEICLNLNRLVPGGTMLWHRIQQVNYTNSMSIAHLDLFGS